MGWSDVSMSLDGPIVESLVHHFADRWYARCTDFCVPANAGRNYILEQKYNAKDPGKYPKLHVPVLAGELPPRLGIGTEESSGLESMIGGLNQMGQRVGRHLHRFNPFNDMSEIGRSLPSETQLPHIQLTRRWVLIRLRLTLADQEQLHQVVFWARNRTLDCKCLYSCHWQRPALCVYREPGMCYHSPSTV